MTVPGVAPWLILIPSELERDRLPVLEGLEDWRTAGRAGSRRALCGVGVVDSALETARLLSSGPRPGRCLLVGLAGTRDAAQAAVGSLVWGTAARNEAIGAGAGEDFVDLSAMGLGPADDECLPLQPLSASERAGIELAIGSRDVPMTTGVLGTVAAASGSPAAARGWARRHPEVLVEDMESWAVGLVARRAGVPLGVLRAVSNVAGERALSRWDLDAAFDALQYALAGLLALPLPRARGAQ